MTTAKFRDLAVAMIMLVTVSGIVFAADPANETWQLRFPSERETRLHGIPVVKEYMDLSIQRWTKRQDTYAARFALISKEYLSSRDVDSDHFKLNDYAFEEYRIIGAKRNYVEVKGFSRSRGWSRIITFRIIIENGLFVIAPSEISRRSENGEVGNFVTTWWTVSDLQY